jgi:hypothetical protein
MRALADAASAARDLGSWRIIGGHMVDLHTRLAGVDLPARATRDADLAVDLLAVRDGALLRRLDELGYRNAASSNRFIRDGSGATATIDILAPSYSTRHERNIDAGEIAAEDLYRLLESAHKSGLAAQAWPNQPTFAAAGRRLRTFFDSPGRAIATATASKQQQVRLRALVRSLVGASEKDP